MNELPETRPSLIARVQVPGDGAAWEEFLSIYRPVVFRFARSRGLQAADAEDLCQQVFSSIARAIPQWRAGPDQPPFRAWLYRIAHNAVLKAIMRRPPDQGAGSSSVGRLLEDTPGADPQLSGRLLQETRWETFRWAAREVRREFSAATWKMFWETAVAGRSIEDVANELARSKGAVYVARCRVMQRIKEKVADLTGSGDIEP